MKVKSIYFTDFDHWTLSSALFSFGSFQLMWSILGSFSIQLISHITEIAWLVPWIRDGQWKISINDPICCNPKISVKLCRWNKFTNFDHSTFWVLSVLLVLFSFDESLPSTTKPARLVHVRACQQYNNVDYGQSSSTSFWPSRLSAWVLLLL